VLRPDFQSLIQSHIEYVQKRSFVNLYSGCMRVFTNNNYTASVTDIPPFLISILYSVSPDITFKQRMNILLFLIFIVVISHCGRIVIHCDNQEQYNSVLLPACSQQDIASQWTPCEVPTNTMSYYYYYPQPLNCTPTIPLPPPIVGIPCDTTCEDRQVFNLNTRQCVTCPAGHFASDVANVETWTSMLAGMTTPCDEDPFCVPWDINPLDGTIECGYNDHNKLTHSYIDYIVKITRPNAKFIFEYKVPTTKQNNFFYLEVDDRSYLNGATEIPDWKVFSMNLSIGVHKIEIDNRRYQGGDDRTKIGRFLVTGLELSTSCTPCDPGSYLSETIMCVLCPPGTYASEYGSETCQQCPLGYTSLIGSSNCFRHSIPCKESDYIYFDTPCDPQTKKRLRMYDWIRPQLCDTNNNQSIPLPRIQDNISCDVDTVCVPGQAPNANFKRCEYCSPSTFSSDGTKCSNCQAGTASTDRLIVIEKFQVRDAYWTDLFLTTTCNGSCFSGWRYTDNFADSGIGNGISDSWINVDLSSVTAKKLILNYGLTCNAGSGSFDITVDGTLYKSMPCSGCFDYTGDSNFNDLEIPVFGAKIVRLNYKTNTLMTQDPMKCGRAVIKKINLSIQDTYKGGAINCEVCPGGQYTSNGTLCELCSAGYHSSKSSAKCSMCQKNTFSYAGSEICNSCGSGTVSQEGASTCYWESGTCLFNSKLFSIDRTFNFGKLGQALSTIAPVMPDDSAQATIYFNLCGTKTKPSETSNPCAEVDGSYICKQDNSGSIVSLGKTVDIQTVTNGQSSQAGILFTFSDLSSKNCFDTNTNQYTNYKSIISVQCDDSDNDSEFSGPTLSKVNSCTYRADFSSHYGCPICTNTDYTVHESQCDPDTLQKTIVYFKKSGKQHQCKGGDFQSKKVDCLIPVKSNTKYWILTIIIIIAIAVPVISIGLYLLIKYKKTNSNPFGRLINSSSSTPKYGDEL
jgi:uncharacterized protein YceK